MKAFVKLALIVQLSLLSIAALATISVYDFSDPQQEARFQHLVEELRCPKCQNNNLADSNAPLAQDLKDIIYEKIKAGESDEAITSFLKARYGDFISYKPPVKPATWGIWFGPFIAIVIGVWLIFRFVGQRGSQATEAASPPEDFRATVAGWADEARQQLADDESTENENSPVAQANAKESSERE